MSDSEHDERVQAAAANLLAAEAVARVAELKLQQERYRCPCDIEAERLALEAYRAADEEVDRLQDILDTAEAKRSTSQSAVGRAAKWLTEQLAKPGNGLVMSPGFSRSLSDLIAAIAKATGKDVTP